MIDKQKIFKISIILTFLSVFYMIFQYFGLTRYAELYIYSSEKFIKPYSKLDRGTKNRVIVSLTTTPDRIQKIKPVVNSLLDQTIKVDLIAITIPYGNEYNIPKDIENGVSVVRCGKNYGKANSVIPVIDREGEAGTKFIVVGDDTIYGKDFLEILLDKSEKNPNSIILCDEKDINKGTVLNTDFFDKSIYDMPKNVDGNKWVLEKIKGIDKKYVKYSENYKIIK